MPIGVMRSFKSRSNERRPAGSGLRRRRLRIASPFSIRRYSLSGNPRSAFGAAASSLPRIEWAWLNWMGWASKIAERISSMGVQ
jgi:hypothetical protein